MKVVEKKVKKKEFKPVTLEITLETQEELNYMYKLARTNVSVPSFLNERTALHDTVFSDIYTIIKRRAKV